MRAQFIIMAVLMIIGLIISIFTTNRLTRFCLYTPLKVLVISIGLSIILWAVSGGVFEGLNIKTYFEMKGKDLFFYPFFVCFSCSIASYSIFLCKIRSVRESRFMTFVCFFILPLLFATILINSQSETNVQMWQTGYYLLAFIIPQTYFYIDFCKKQNRKWWDRK